MHARKSPEFFELETSNHVLTITINRPQVRNALHAPACHELSEILYDFQANEDQWIAIITGKGHQAFCSGHDLTDGFDEPLPPTGWAGMADRTDITKPVIAAVNGYCFGGGWEIALCCDIVVADTAAVFCFSEPRVGLAALGGGAERLAVRVPAPIAMGMLLTARRVPAEEAARWGLVNEICPAGQALDGARRWAASMLECAPRALQFTKEIATRGVDGPGDHASLHGRRREMAKQLRRLSDTKEGIDAFKERRKPVWTNR